jgi:hypothetical protein
MLKNGPKICPKCHQDYSFRRHAFYENLREIRKTKI